ncbi:MAG: glutathione peroxidase [Deltaproteobacteria bacterium]|nr:glutathione peroxidase [Deltaproteobacteria bacterium]
MSIPTASDLEGTVLPALTFRFREGAAWVERTTADVFAGKRVVAFALPGAFTPTCSSSHVPRYDELADAFGAAGIDELVVISVNDPFVMEAWEKDQGTTRVTYLPDGNGELTGALGMLVDKGDLRFGSRSWRYAMVVDDGVVEKAFIEDDVPGDPFDVSDADTVLAWLSPTDAPLDVVLVGRDGCSHCVRAKGLLHDAGIAFEEIASSPRRLKALSGRTSTPQIWVGGDHIGGADELEVWLSARAAA